MKRSFSAIPILTFLMAILLGNACNEPTKQDLPTEKSSASITIPADHPKLIKTIGDPKYGHVNCIMQDKVGSLWLGTTENGLYKYDGKSFHQFLKADGLISNGVNDILEDQAGKIWIGTQKGLCVYDGNAFQEVQIPLPKNLPPNTNKFYQTHIVHDMLRDQTGKLWFATIDGVYVYDGQSFELFVIDPDGRGFMGRNDIAERMFEDQNGHIWFGGRTNEGVYRYDGKSVTNFKLPELYQNGPTPKPHNWAWPQVQDKNGNIWFSNWGGAYRYDGNAFTSFTKKDGLPGMVVRIVEDKKGNLWFGGDGICRYDGTSFTCFTEKDGLLDTGVWSILEDASGKLWVGTWGTGLYLFDGQKWIAYSEYQHKSAAK